MAKLRLSNPKAGHKLILIFIIKNLNPVVDSCNTIPLLTYSAEDVSHFGNMTSADRIKDGLLACTKEKQRVVTCFFGVWCYEAEFEAE